MPEEKSHLYNCTITTGTAKMPKMKQISEKELIFMITKGFLRWKVTMLTE